MVLDCTTNMGGVNYADQYASTYCFMRKSLKWWRKLFLGELECVLLILYRIYRTSEERKNKKQICLVSRLRGDFRESRTRASTSSSHNRLNNNIFPMWVKENRTVLFVLVGKHQLEDVKRPIIVKRVLTSLKCISEIVSKFITL